jgi:hypothetical protein
LISTSKPAKFVYSNVCGHPVATTHRAFTNVKSNGLAAVSCSSHASTSARTASAASLLLLLLLLVNQLVFAAAACAAAATAAGGPLETLLLLLLLLLAAAHKPNPAGRLVLALLLFALRAAFAIATALLLRALQDILQPAARCNRPLPQQSSSYTWPMS